MLMIVRAGPLPGDEQVDNDFKEALKQTLKSIRFNKLSRFYYEHLPPRVPFVGGPPVSPQGITCSRPSTV
jgi:hypothetical protein